MSEVSAANCVFWILVICSLNVVWVLQTLKKIVLNIICMTVHSIICMTLVCIQGV